MDNQILTVKQMKLDKLKSRIEELNTEVKNIDVLNTSIIEFDKKINDSRFILNELEKRNQTFASELMSKEIYHKKQHDKYKTFEEDFVTMTKKITDLKSQIALQKLQNLSYEERIHEEQKHLDCLKEEYANLEAEHDKYYDMWRALVDTMNGYVAKIKDFDGINKRVVKAEEEKLVNLSDDHIDYTKIYKKNSPTEFDCSGSNVVKTISNIRPTVKVFNCSNTCISELPELPDSLEELNCSNTNITKLPKLPNGLKILRWEECGLEELPELPDSLIHLIVGGNRLVTLPKLPDGLEILVCCRNELKSLPTLPTKKLIRLDCFMNKFKALPELPNTLQYLWVDPYITMLNKPQNLKEFKTWKNGIFTEW
jgi:Leucine-rich repeat (LRR) protein